MRVLKITQSYYPFLDAGGPATKVRALAQALAARGHQVTVVAADLGLTPRQAHDVGCARGPWGWEARTGRVEVVYLKSLARYRRLTVHLAAGRFFRRAVPGFDIAHIYGLYDLLGPSAGWAARAAGIPYVLEPLGMTRPMDRSFRRKRAWMWWYGRKLYAGAARIIATSEMEQQELLDDGYPQAKVRLRWNGVSREESAAALPGSFRAKWRIGHAERVVLFLSRVIPRKGADLLIEAFAALNGGGGRLVIAGPEGESGYTAQLKQLAEQRGVAGRVIFAGPLYGAEKQAALADADVFALPSSYENFANVVAEAVASGVPVIVTERCGIGPLVAGKAGVVIRREAGELTRALQELLENQALRTRLRAGCAEVAGALGWDKLAAEMEAHYLQALAETVGRGAGSRRG